MAKWLLDDAVDGNIYTIAQNREVKWSWKIGSKPIGIRHCRFNRHTDVRTWLRMLQADQRPVDMYVGTNLIDWSEVPELPPPFRIAGKGYNREGIENYDRLWKTWLTPADCEKQGLDFNKIWIGKNMVWDFDHPELDKAFEWAHAVYLYLQAKDLSPQMVFSGKKGFHIWLHHEESAYLVGTDLETLSKEVTDPLQVLGKLYADKVKEITFNATQVPHRILDLSPNYRQGVIRIPYSINSEGQIVWPLSGQDIDNLLQLREWTTTTVAKTLHPAEWKERWAKSNYIRGPANKVFRRLLSIFTQ